jgi:hypothetical protein
MQNIQKSIQYTVNRTAGAITKYLQYVVSVPLSDDEDYSKRMNLHTFKQKTISLWYRNLIFAGGVSNSVDVSTANMASVYVQVDGATTITLEVQVVNGWTPLLTWSPTAADFHQWQLWNMPFTAIRLTTSNTVTITSTCTIKM